MGVSDTFDALSIFSEISRQVTSQALRSGSALSIFGNVTIDLSEADVAETSAAINVTAVFGNIELIVPPDWSVDNQVLQIFGGVSDRRSSQPKLKMGEGPQAALSGVSVFGNVEVTTVSRPLSDIL